MMGNDPIVEEMQMYGQEFAARHGNDIRRIYGTLRQSEIASRRKVVRREPKRLSRNEYPREANVSNGNIVEIIGALATTDR